MHVNGSIFSVGKFWNGPWTRHWNGVRSHNHTLGLSRVSLCSSWKIDKLKVVRVCLANIIRLKYRLFKLICLKPSYFKLENLTNRLFGKFNPIKLKKKTCYIVKVVLAKLSHNKNNTSKFIGVKIVHTTCAIIKVIQRIL